MIGWAFRQLVIWGGLGLLLYTIVGHRDLLILRDDGQAAAAAPAQTGPAMVLRPAIGNVLSYHADPRGQFWVDGAANGANVRFLVDTGASSVVLTLADAAAGGIGRGSLAFFERLQNLEFRMNIAQDNTYQRTHPVNGERIAALQTRYQSDPAWNARTDPALEARFLRVRGKLSGYVDDPALVLRRFPTSDHSVQAHYARAYAWHRTGHPDEANAEVAALIAGAPHDPYFLELQGQVLLESGHPAEAVTALREAVQRSNDSPLIATLLGHALISTEDPANFEEAKRVLRVAVGRDNDNPFAWYQLGIVYDREGDEARAALATAERYNLQGQPGLALPNAERAMMGLPAHSSDWLRAQDIAMVSRTAVQRNGRRSRQ